ncbi:type I restriction enzyme, S subunit [Paracoccus solventivorans]|uniref:Type I restriction enzyme, S subunit n=1 Tax=Paracoccus solventivorans TaxID=53463 RepID=A0A1M7DUI2_9RHOB|nr:restriction endonuclease subunit S [Paracoccus solventivorans]SHL83028.1 type I restriction enzyme, S subunit [Paracoccus solventivorans]
MSFGEDIAALVERTDSALVQKASWWYRVPLGHVSEILNGYPFPSQHFSSEHGVPLIRIRDVTSGKTDTKFSGDIPEGYWIEEGDYVIGMDGDFNARRWSGKRGLLNQRVCKIMADRRFLDIEFLSFILPGYLKLINDYTPSVTVKHLSSRTLQATPIPLPSLPEQRRIVRKLDTLSARTTTARTHLTAIEKLVERYKLAVLRSAYAGNLTADFREDSVLEPVSALLKRTPPPQQGRGGRQATTEVKAGQGGISVNIPDVNLPEKWEWVSLLRIARQETGHTPSRSRDDWWGGDVCWMSIPDANLHHGRVISDTIQKTNEQGLANSSARLLPAGTVVLSRTASVGYICIMGREMATSQDFATWTCTDALLPEYLMYALLSEGEDIKKFGEGSTHTTIYFPEIRAFHIKLAPLDEQREIVRRIETAFAKIDRLATEAAKALKLLGRLDQRILAKAFVGELVPQDPTDEPAEALLARIREARAATPKARRGRKTRA